MVWNHQLDNKHHDIWRFFIHNSWGAPDLSIGILWRLWSLWVTWADHCWGAFVRCMCFGRGAQKEWEDISQVNNINPAKRTPSIKVLQIWLVLLNNQRVMLIESSTFKSFLPRRVVKSNMFFLCDRSCMMILMLSPASHIFWYILIVGLRFPSLKVRKLWSRKKGQRNPGWRPGGWFDSEYPKKNRGTCISASSFVSRLDSEFVGWKPLDSRFGEFLATPGLKYTVYKRDALQIWKWKMPQKSVLVISTLEGSMQMYADRGDLLSKMHWLDW